MNSTTNRATRNHLNFIAFGLLAFVLTACAPAFEAEEVEMPKSPFDGDKVLISNPVDVDDEEESEGDSVANSDEVSQNPPPPAATSPSAATPGSESSNQNTVDNNSNAESAPSNNNPSSTPAVASNESGSGAGEAPPPQPEPTPTPSAPVSDATVLPGGTTFDIVVDDVCLDSRLAANGPIKYLVDSYIKRSKLVKDSNLYHESVLTVPMSRPLTIGQLRDYAYADRCVIGLTDHVPVKFVPTELYSDPEYSAQKILYDLVGFEKGDLFSKTKIAPDVRVKVAVIDSGLDLANPETGLTDKVLLGSDFVEVDNEPQDTNGHGTEVASLLNAKGGNGKGGVGLGHRFIEVLPIRVTDGAAGIGSGGLADAIKYAVNRGAEVINLSLAGVVDREYDPNKEDYDQERKLDKDLMCSPIYGHILQRAIERRAIVVMAGGHGTSYEKFRPGHVCEGRYIPYKFDSAKNAMVADQNGQLISCEISQENCKTLAGQTCRTRLIPGPVYSPRENGPLLFGNNSVPACWSRYLKGAIAVAALNSETNFTDFSNWGFDGIEMAAPGEGVVVTTLSGRKKVVKGTSFAAPFVSAAAAYAVALLKTKQKETGNEAEWRPSPWLVEDLLMAGSRGLASLKFDQNLNQDHVLRYKGKKFRTNDIPRGQYRTINGRMVHLGDLSDFLTAWSQKSYDERRRLASDNQELNEGHGVEDNTAAGVTLAGLHIYPQTLFSRSGERMQIQGVALYSNATSRVVSDRVSWSSSDSKVKIDNQGVAYFPSPYKGSVKLFGKYEGFSGETSVAVDDNDLISGGASLAPDSLDIVEAPNVNYPGHLGHACFSKSFYAYANYPGGSRRGVTGYVSWVPPKDYVRDIYAGPGGFSLKQADAGFAPGSQGEVHAFYYGVQGSLRFTEPSCPTPYKLTYVGDRVEILTSGVQSQVSPAGFSNRYARGTVMIESGNTLTLLKKGTDPDLESITLGFAYEKAGYSRESLTGFLSEASTMKVSLPKQADGKLRAGRHEFSYSMTRPRYSDVGGERKTDTFKLVLEIVEAPRNLERVAIRCYESVSNSYKECASSSASYSLLFPPPVVMGYYSDSSQQVLPASESTWRMDKSPGVPYTSAKLTLFNPGFSPALYPNKYSDNVTVSLKHGPSGFEASHAVVMNGALSSPQISVPVKIVSRDKFAAGFRLPTGVVVSETGITNSRSPDPLCASASDLTPAAGDGSAASPYLICSARQFIEVGGISRLSKYIKLLNHIDFSGIAIEKITQFSDIDGNGYEIRNFHTVGEESGFAGLIRIVSGVDKSRILNLGFRNIAIKSAQGIILSSFGVRDLQVSNLYFDQIEMENDVVSLLFSADKVSVNGLYITNTRLAGKGILSPLGGRDNSISNAWVNISLQHSSVPGFGSSMGGLFADGGGDLTIDNSVVIVTARSRAAQNGPLGGLIGKTSDALPLNDRQDVKITNVEVYGDLESTGDKVGGFVGNGSPFIINSSYSGRVAARDYVSGGVGIGSAVMNGVMVTASVTGAEYVGGLVGALSGYSILENNNLEKVQVTSRGRYRSDFVAKLETASSRGVLVPSANYTLPVKFVSNRFIGQFLFDNQTELQEGFVRILSSEGRP